MRDHIFDNFIINLYQAGSYKYSFMNNPPYNPNNAGMDVKFPTGNAQHTHFVSQVALTACGFEQATRSSTPKQIWNIHPHGGTAMRDALIYGNQLMTNLHDLLERDHTINSWNFLHILITDGHDTDSSISYEQTYMMLSTLRADMNVKDLKIIILGVDIQPGYAQSLTKLVMAAGIHGQYHDITHTDINRIFHKIRGNFGLGDRQKYNPNNPALNQIPNMVQQYYAVLFTLDISGSMTGHKWDVTRHAVVDFIRYLGPYDIVSAVVFNDYPHLVMHWNTRQNQMKLGTLTNQQPYKQIMANQPYYDPNQFGGGLGQPLIQGNRNVQYVVRDPYDDGSGCCILI